MSESGPQWNPLPLGKPVEMPARKDEEPRIDEWIADPESLPERAKQIDHIGEVGISVYDTIKSNFKQLIEAKGMAVSYTDPRVVRELCNYLLHDDEASGELEKIKAATGDEPEESPVRELAELSVPEGHISGNLFRYLIHAKAREFAQADGFMDPADDGHIRDLTLIGPRDYNKDGISYAAITRRIRGIRSLEGLMQKYGEEGLKRLSQYLTGFSELHHRGLNHYVFGGKRHGAIHTFTDAQLSEASRYLASSDDDEEARDRFLELGGSYISTMKHLTGTGYGGERDRIHKFTLPTFEERIERWQNGAEPVVVADAIDESKITGDLEHSDITNINDEFLRKQLNETLQRVGVISRTRHY